MNNHGIEFLMGGALLLFGAFAFVIGRKQKTTTDNGNMNNKNLPRGYRNNNPLNLRISNNNWAGKVYNNTDGAFEQFSSMAYGYRAAFMTIRNYIHKYRIYTVSGIIYRWAPASENNTEGYIKRVCSISGMQADTVIDPNNEKQMEKLVYAMSIVENGTKPTPDKNAIVQGWTLYIMAL